MLVFSNTVVKVVLTAKYGTVFKHRVLAKEMVGDNNGNTEN